MNHLICTQPKEVLHALILPNGYIPNNKRFPFLLYRQAIASLNLKPEKINKILESHQWINSWVDGIYDYHHYHSNTHESLVILQGNCKVQIGGEQGVIYDVTPGDVVIFPAGVAHKNVGASPDFKCMGSYPTHIEYDMNYGKSEEHPLVDNNIQKVGMPNNDPLYGPKGILFTYWNN
jgi:uncharacterized protein YjlB